MANCHCDMGLDSHDVAKIYHLHKIGLPHREKKKMKLEITVVNINTMHSLK